MTKGGELAKAQLKSKGSPLKGAKRNGSRGKVVSAINSTRAESIGNLSKDERAQWQQQNGKDCAVTESARVESVKDSLTSDLRAEWQQLGGVGLPIAEAALALGISRSQLKRYIASGCPQLRQGSRGRGHSALLDPRAISSW